MKNHRSQKISKAKLEATLARDAKTLSGLLAQVPIRTLQRKWCALWSPDYNTLEEAKAIGQRFEKEERERIFSEFYNQMKLAHVLEKVFHEPWLITPGGYSSVVALVESKLAGQLAQTDEDETVLGLKVPRVEATIDADGVATVPIAGILGNKISNIEKVCGAVDYLDIQKATVGALDKGAKGILYAFDSSGGMVRGCAELANYIRGLPVPTAAFTDSKCNSAAYWLASACNSITATESADVGSIGVILPWIDRSKLWEATGIKWDAIANKGADLKGTGAGPSLTPEQRQYLQSTVDHVGAKFRATVTSRRPQVAPGVPGRDLLR